MISSLFRLLVLAATAFLASCGGGSGDGQSEPETKFVVDTSEIAATFFNGQGNNVQNSYGGTQRHVRIQATTPIVESLYGAVLDSGGVFGSGAIELRGAGFGEYALTVVGNPDLPPGSYAGTLTLSVCKDPSCTNRYQVIGEAIPYSIAIVPQLAIDVYVSDRLVKSLPSWIPATNYFGSTANRKIEIRSNLPVELKYVNQVGYYELVQDVAASTALAWVGSLNVVSDAVDSIYVEAVPSHSTGSSQAPYQLVFSFE